MPTTTRVYVRVPDDNDDCTLSLADVQQESLNHIKNLYSAAAGVEVLRASKHHQLPHADYLVPDDHLQLAPKWRPHVS